MMIVVIYWENTKTWMIVKIYKILEGVGKNAKLRFI